MLPLSVTTDSALEMHQLWTIVEFVSKRMVIELYELVLTDVDDEGAKMFRKEINKKPLIIRVNNKMYWIKALIQRVFQVTCWFYHIISPGSVWQALT